MATINVLLTTFPGLNLPPTLCLPVPKELSVASLFDLVGSLLSPQVTQNTLLTAASGRVVFPSPNTVESLLPPADNQHEASTLVSLRLYAPLRGGKGGFGSQLRA